MTSKKEEGEAKKDEMTSKKEKIKGKVKDVHEACKTEIETFCSDIKKGKGRILKCLNEKQGEEGFGEECKTKVEELGKKVKKHKGKK